MKRKVLAGIVTVAMVASLAACGGDQKASTATNDAGANDAQTTNAGSDDEGTAAQGSADEGSEGTAVALDRSWPEETVLIGVETFDTTSDQFLSMQSYFDYLSENFNVEFMYSEALSSPEDEMNFIESCASAGAKGMIGYYNISGAEAMQAAMDKGMYYWGTEQYYDQFANNEMYAGCYTLPSSGDVEGNGDYMGGYEMGYSLGKQGVKHVFYCNGGASMGIQMFIDRQAGFEAGIAAAQAEGAEIQYDPAADVVEGWPDAPDFAAAVGSKLSGDYDGVAAAFDAAALFQPIMDANKADSIKVATIGAVCDTYYDFVQSGLLSTIVYECEEVEFGNAVVQILNAVSGETSAYMNADGTANKISCYRWVVTDADSYDKIYSYHDAGNWFVSAEDVASMLVGYNPDITAQEVNDFYASLTLEKALEIAQ